MFLKKLVLNALQGIDAMHEISNKSLDAILEACVNLHSEAELERKTALRANIHSLWYSLQNRERGVK